MIITILTEQKRKKRQEKSYTKPLPLHTEAPSVPRDIYAGHSGVNYWQKQKKKSPNDKAGLTTWEISRKRRQSLNPSTKSSQNQTENRTRRRTRVKSFRTPRRTNRIVRNENEEEEEESSSNMLGVISNVACQPSRKCRPCRVPVQLLSARSPFLDIRHSLAGLTDFICTM
jgi:hypothetical protein